MKANTPDKLYVDVQDNLDDSFLYGFIEKSGDEDIEYVRKDSFIEKAVDYIANNMRCDGYTMQTKTTFIKGFKNYIKGE